MKAKHASVGARRDWLVAALAAIGLVDSAYLAWIKWSGGAALFCESGSGCDVVQASRYALFFGVPTASWGVLLYAVVIGLALAGLTARRWVIAYGLAVVAVAFSGYLTWLSLVTLRAVCPYCIADALLATALLVTLVVRRPAAGARRLVARPRGLLALGATLAVLTIVFAVGAFMAGTPTAASAYQEALARHLAASGAIFYGAYW